MFSHSLDLDIDIKQILKKMGGVISFTRVEKDIIEDADMGGPVIVAILFGLLLLMVITRSNFIEREGFIRLHLRIRTDRVCLHIQSSEGDDKD